MYFHKSGQVLSTFELYLYPCKLMISGLSAAIDRFCRKMPVTSFAGFAVLCHLHDIMLDLFVPLSSLTQMLLVILAKLSETYLLLIYIWKA